MQMEMILMRNVVAGCASLTLFAGSVFVAPTSFADDAARLEQLEAEIASLKEKNRQQDLKIESLEKLSASQSSAQSEAVSRPSSGSFGSPGAWSRIKDGMSEAQVTQLLGPPTSTKILGPYKTLFFEGPVPGSGSVSGNVELRDNRVYNVNVPVF
jgi:hypothetical protein